ncbi:selenocysteine-specific elongation factor [Silvibacterium bohemicum]|uniref:Selenocysteine-specific elongation factor n=1 Tax=Silvibacterium bohemicum TaxID=1577686 RepID=A0A841JVZ2_9BACT|nr:selenocysteine-specific translation elongation factor [Silvibacterium bohemicum]MBB6143141.1 selenocysteine-specific elongation factor [Silvibacterium bohemicum]
MTKPSKSIVIGTAGHIDHGKTMLVRALTGVDTDRLPEEKRRGITIDLGFAFLDATGPDGSSWRISFVDVPGHSLFIRNMLAGAGCIDAVLLVISAEEGVKPQTEEHLAICTLLGVRRGLTVVTKADAVSPARLEQVCSDIRTFLSDTFLEESRAAILPVSAHTGQGIDELRRELLSLAMSATSHNPDHLPRLPLDRAFVMKGFGTVVTGTLLSGELQVGESLTLEPGSRSVRVRGMQTHGRPEERVESGSRVALNLAGIEVSDVSRGQTLVSEGTLTSTSVIDVDAMLLPGSSVVKHRSRVHFHAFTSDTLATVSLYGYEAAEPGVRRLMRLKLQQPIVLVPGDHFVLRQPSPAATIGGGRVLDAHPLPNLRKAKCLAWLESLKDTSPEEQLLLRVARRGSVGLAMHELMAETGFTPEALERHVERFVSSGHLFRIPGNRLLSKECAETGINDISNRLKKSAKSDGLKRSELKGQTGLNAAIFDFLIETLASRQEIRLQDERIYPAGQPQSIDPDLKQRSAIATIYEAAGLAAPSSSEVAVKLGLNESEMRRLMTRLLREKILIKMGTDALYIHHGALETLRGRVRELRGQMLDVSGFKQLTGLSRKYAIPLLEYLDRERVTRKDGEKRLVL